ncbi:MAG TPA: class I SAM-dependent methyltransferase, partial [Chitinophagaceae bacterium]|nr:class I SAM-dependent methyltransferase [Chitinophagaceae bacterium]
YVLEKGFGYLSRLCEKDSFVDFGCGKGRALAVAAYYGFKNITGIDFSPALCSIAEENIDGIKALYPGTAFNILCEDAVNYKIPKDQAVFFFFNPFDEVVMLTVVKNMLASLKENPRKVYVMYANSVYKEIFLSAGFEEIYYFRKMRYLEMTILTKELQNSNSNAPA